MIRAGIGRVDDVVDLEQLSGVERLGILLCRRRRLAYAFLALIVVGDRLQFLAQPQPDGALESHRAEVGARPRHGEQRLVQAATRHRLGAETVTAAQHDRDERNAQRGARDEHAGRASHQRFGLGGRPDHVARAVDERHDGKPEAVAQLQEAGRLVGRGGGDRARHVPRVVGDHPDGPALDPGERGHHLAGEARPQERHRTLVGQRLDDRADVVGAPGALGNHCAQGCLVGARHPARSSPGSSPAVAWSRRPPPPRRRRRRRPRRWAPAPRSARPRRGGRRRARRRRSSPDRPCRSRRLRWPR